jgi:hypothetical protein
MEPDLRAMIFDWYDGYSWDGETRVFNPFSLLYFFMQKEFKSFWFNTGTPKFLVDLIEQNPEEYFLAVDSSTTDPMLDTDEIHDIDLTTLLFQTGYLTVAGIEKGPKKYRLGFPNAEVRVAFNNHLLARLTHVNLRKTEGFSSDMLRSFATCDMDLLQATLKALFAAIPHQLHLENEKFYHSIFYTMMLPLHADIHAGESTAHGRIDAVLKIGSYVYIIEFKHVKTPLKAASHDTGPDGGEDAGIEPETALEAAMDRAMAQIEARGYADKYRMSGKHIVKVAIAVAYRDHVAVRFNEEINERSLH